MLAEILQRLRKPSFATAQVTDLLFDLAVYKEGSDSLIESAGLRSIEDISLTKVRTEIALLNLCAVFTGMFLYKEVKERHRSNLDRIYSDLLGRFKTSTHPSEFLQTYEERLIDYSLIVDSWLRAHQNNRGHEQSIAIGQAFCGFCGVRTYNPACFTLIQCHFFSTVNTVRENLMKL